MLSGRLEFGGCSIFKVLAGEWVSIPVSGRFLGDVLNEILSLGLPSQGSNALDREFFLWEFSDRRFLLGYLYY